MKALVLFTILFVTIDIFLEGVSNISTLDNETYDVFVQLIKGEFAVPVKSKTNKQKSAVVRFWRNREKLSLQGGMLCFNGKRVVKRETLHDVVKRMYKSSKGSGVRKIYHKLKNSYSSVAERDVHEGLPNKPFIKGLTFALKTGRSLALAKQDFDQSVPEQYKFDIK